MSNSASQAVSTINFTVQLDEQKIPEKIFWSGSDESMEKPKPTKSIIVSIWDANEDSAMRIDLWTKDMRIDEMDTFYFQTIMSMADSYIHATGNKELAEDMKAFGRYFGEKTKILKEPA